MSDKDIQNRVNQFPAVSGSALAVAPEGAFPSGQNVPQSEEGIVYLENQFPALSGSAFAAAREQALASGQSVLQSEDGIIYEVFPNGTRRHVKEIEQPRSVTPGSKISIR